MKRLKLYIETSVWNFLFAEDEPDKHLKHIVKVKTIAGINEINLIEGYRELKICTVQGVVADE